MTHHEWFAPRRFGIGAGLPIAWQGWLTLVLFFALLAAVMIAIEPGTPLFIGSILLLAGMLALVTAFTTRGGWRWRSGKDD